MAESDIPYELLAAQMAANHRETKAELRGVRELVGERMNNQDGKIESIVMWKDEVETRVGTLEVAVKVAAIVGAVILTILGAYASHIFG